MRPIWELKNSLTLVVDYIVPQGKTCEFCSEQAKRKLIFTWNDKDMTHVYLCEEHYLLLEPLFFEIKKKIESTVWANFEQGKPGWLDEWTRKTLREYLTEALIAENNEQEGN
jgi:hypothetical protein